jgi:hypothetical protein
MGVAPVRDYGIHELLIGAFVLHGVLQSCTSGAVTTQFFELDRSEVPKRLTALPPIDPCGGAVCFGRSDSEKPAGESIQAEGCPMASRAAKRASGLAGAPVLEAAARPSPLFFLVFDENDFGMAARRANERALVVARLAWLNVDSAGRGAALTAIWIIDDCR